MASEYLTTTVMINSAGILLLNFLLRSLVKRIQKSHFKLPCVNERRKLELSYANVKKRFQTDAASLLQRGFEQSAKGFRLFTDIGPVIVLPPESALLLRNDERFSITKFTTQEFHVNIAGFEPFKAIETEQKDMNRVIQNNLTRGLVQMSDTLAAEASLAVQRNWGDDTEWHEVALNSTILNIVAQISSRIFTGDKLCHDPQWLHIVITFTTNVMTAVYDLNLWPKFLRPIASHFLSSCRRLQTQIKRASNLIDLTVAERRAEKAASKQRGEKPQEPSDAIEWLEDIYNGRQYDLTVAQLLLAFAGIHTTSDLLTKALFDISSDPELVDNLRKEIISVIGEQGWSKNSLYNLKLMDSALKESQRLKPLRIFGMGRIATTTIELPGGFTIPKGTSVIVSSHTRLDPNTYPEPYKYDGYRFLHLRQQNPEQERYCQLVSSAKDHMGFGFGKHTCPGRFFAAAEVKIALCHILLKYDIMLVDDTPPKPIQHGFNVGANSTAMLKVRRRKEEIPLLPETSLTA